MKLEPANIVCPKCGNPNYMRHLIGWNVGHLDMKCINCNSYFNFDELRGQKRAESNADRIRQMTDEELARFMTREDLCALTCGEPCIPCDGACERHMLDWLKEEEGETDEP